MIDAFKRASAGRITAVIPYYAYGRSDKKDQPRVPITARLIADMITRRRRRPGADDGPPPGPDPGLLQHPGRRADRRPHAARTTSATSSSRTWWSSRTSASPSAPATFAEMLDAPLAIIEKRRQGNLDRAELMNVIGEVRGKRAIIVDDEIDTGRHAHGDRPRARARGRRPRSMPAPRTACCAIRPSTGSATASLREIVLTDTIPLPPAKRLAQDQDAVRGAAHRRGDPAHPPRRIGRARCSRSELSFTQEMLLWEDGADEGAASGRRRADDGDGADWHGGAARPWPQRRTRRPMTPPAPPTRRRGRPRAARPSPRPDWRTPAAFAALGQRRCEGGRCRSTRTPR